MALLRVGAPVGGSPPTGTVRVCRRGRRRGSGSGPTVRVTHRVAVRRQFDRPVPRSASSRFPARTGAFPTGCGGCFAAWRVTTPFLNGRLAAHRARLPWVRPRQLVLLRFSVPRSHPDWTNPGGQFGPVMSLGRPHLARQGAGLGKRHCAELAIETGASNCDACVTRTGRPGALTPDRRLASDRPEQCRWAATAHRRANPEEGHDTQMTSARRTGAPLHLRRPRHRSPLMPVELTRAASSTAPPAGAGPDIDFGRIRPTPDGYPHRPPPIWPGHGWTRGGTRLPRIPR